MTQDLRWRILGLQLVAIIVLAFCAGIGYWAHSFTHDQVTSQLSAQQIAFPAASSPALTALPASDAGAMRQYAGQQMTTGDQAQTYANSFISVHLGKIGQGKTYAYWSGLALSTKDKAVAAKADGIALTLFRGETLKSLLLQAWAFWFAGTLALYAAIGLTIGSLVVLLAFLFELVIAPRRQGIVSTKPGPRRGVGIPNPVSTT
jgi:hypothetical protein